MAVSVPSKALARVGQLWVHPEHEQELRRFAERLDARGRLVTLVVVGLSILMVITAVLGSQDVLDRTTVGRAAGVQLAAMGALLVLVPLTTIQTMESFGIRRSLQVARVIGAITVALGAWIAMGA